MEYNWSMIELFKLGGPFMWILLIFSIATMALIVERCIYIFWHDCKVEPLAKEIKAMLKNGKKDAAETKIEAEECVRNITGTYGDEVQPRSPGGRGYTGFFRKLYCISDADRKNKIEFLLKVSPEQLQQSAQRILAGKDKCRSVIIGDKPQKNTGVIIELPL